VTNIFGITGSDGRVSLRVYPVLGDESLLSVCYSDPDFTQKRTISIATSGETQVNLGYNARVTVFTSEISLLEDERATLLATVSDANGDLLPLKTVDAMHFIADDRVVSANCPGTNSVTNSRGIASVVFCPARSGLYYLRANGAVPSQFVRVTFRAPRPPGGDDGGGSGGGNGDGSSGGGGGSDGDGSSGPAHTTIPAVTTTTIASTTTIARTSSGSAPKLPLSAGSIITVGSPPPLSIAAGIAVAATSRTATVGLATPRNVSRSQQVDRYVVTLRSGSGTAVKTVVLKVPRKSNKVVTSINVPTPGTYSLQIVARNGSGKRIGKWQSSAFTIAKRPGIWRRSHRNYPLTR
jgi:hypothetical protein